MFCIRHNYAIYLYCSLLGQVRKWPLNLWPEPAARPQTAQTFVGENLSSCCRRCKSKNSLFIQGEVSHFINVCTWRVFDAKQVRKVSMEENKIWPIPVPISFFFVQENDLASVVRYLLQTFYESSLNFANFNIETLLLWQGLEFTINFWHVWNLYPLIQVYI